MALQDRAKMLFKLADLVEQHAEELALLESLVSTQGLGLSLQVWVFTSCMMPV